MRNSFKTVTFILAIGFAAAYVLGQAQNGKAASKLKPLDKEEVQVEISINNEGKTNKIATTQYHGNVDRGKEFGKNLGVVEDDPEKGSGVRISGDHFMQAEYMGVGTVSDGKALQDILTPLRYECPEIDFKRNIALLLCCGNSSCVRMTLNYLSVVKGKCDGAVCTYEFREKASRDRKTFTVVIIPKEAVGEGRPK